MRESARKDQGHPLKANRALFYSVSISVILHATFFLSATGLRMPGAHTVLDRTKRFFNIKALEQKLPEAMPIKKRGIIRAGVLKFQGPASPESISRVDNAEEEMEEFAISSPQETIAEPIKGYENKSLDDIVGTEKEYAALGKATQRDTRKDLVELGEVGDEELFSGTEELLRGSELPADFVDKMPGFTPAMTSGFTDSAKDKLLSKSYIPAVRRKTNFTDLKQYLICELSTYQDPQDNQRYFKISIRSGRDVANLSKMPKEIVFLVDCSLSMQPKRLERFKNGLSYCLNNLDTDDYFNVAAFKERIFWLNPHSVKPESSKIEGALRFIDTLTAGEGTDAYRALHETIQTEPTILPSYLILFSDGRPTYGVTDSRQIINEISTFNNGKRPVFAFSAGSRVNRYFLDFISYKNRGWTEYAPYTYLIERHIAGMYDKIRDPILLNLRYRASGINEDELVPKTLPDFFKNAEFTLFGRYKDEDELSLQLLGDSKGQTNEFIIMGSLKEAVAGDKNISRDWAFNKIYYLIGLLERSKGNEDILKEISSLCSKFDIKTPYSDEIKQ